MAEINLGNIKFNWRGAYAGGTAYVVDDVVSSAGSSYVCILASTGNTPPNGTYWNLMAEAGTDGTNGTDVLTTLTTTGDMLYRDGSGAQRLGIGTAGQELKVNSGATAPEWYTPTGGVDNTPIVLAYLNGSQVIPSNTATKFVPNGTLVNTDNVYNTSTGAFTPNVAGYYRIRLQTGGPNYNGVAAVIIRVGSTDYYCKDESAGNSYLETGERIIYFNGSSDSAEFRCFFSGGRTITGNTTSGNTIVQIFKIIT